MITATFPPYRGGTGRVCFENARGLVRLGHQVDVYTASEGTSSVQTVIDGVNVHWLPAAARIGNAPLTPGLARIPAADIVHLHYPYVFGQELVWLRSFARKTRLVITYHQDLILTGLMDKAVRAHHALVGKALLRRANRLIVTSLDYGAASRVAPLMQSNTGQVVEVSNGVDASRFVPSLDGASVRTRYGWKPDDLVVLFVGGLDTPHYFKGVDHLIRAVAFIPNSCVKLLVVGDGDLRPRYEALAASLGLGAHAVFAGQVRDEDLPAHYAACDLTVLPSVTRGEAFGIVLLEAMACAKPVIASNLPGVRSVVDHDVNGLLTPPGDAGRLSQAIAALLASPDTRQRMGEQGRRKVVARYDWPTVVERLQAVFDEVMAA
jgi:glycosyltransferase involved in cell wall biosynthesis